MEKPGMLRKSLFVTLGVLGLILAGSTVGSAPAQAGYKCGPWNAWCGRAWLYPGWGQGYGKHHWRKSYDHRRWDNDRHRGKGKHAYEGKRWKKYD
jgi:hypothetical protein